ncbi:MAG: glycosyltransferase family 4 protein [Motilibacteraceae bacterium]
MRVLMLSWEYPPLLYGGLGRHVHALAEAQAAAGHDVVVLTQQADGAEPNEVVGGVRLVRAPLDPPFVPLEENLLAWTLGLNHSLARAGLAVTRDWRPEVVHAHDWLVTHAATTLKHALGVPLVATVHATEAGRHQGWLPTALSKAIHGIEWWLTFEARRVITCSEAMRWEVHRLFELPDDTTDVVANGIDLPRWRPEPARVRAMRERFAGEGPLLVCSGRLEWEKGVHTVVKAMPRLRRRFPGVRLVVAGRGSKEQDLRELAADKRVSRAVEFAGWLEREDLVALTAAADVALVPSIYEPFGLVALEAAAAGTPLVVADTGGLREFVRDGVTGLRFSPRNVPGCADAVTRLLRDEVLGRRLAREARRALQRDHRWEDVAERTVQVYRRAVREEQELPEGLRAGRAAARPRPVVRDGNLLRDDTA